VEVVLATRRAGTIVIRTLPGPTARFPPIEQCTRLACGRQPASPHTGGASGAALQEACRFEMTRSRQHCSATSAAAARRVCTISAAVVAAAAAAEATTAAAAAAARLSVRRARSAALRLSRQERALESRPNLAAGLGGRHRRDSSGSIQRVYIRRPSWPVWVCGKRKLIEHCQQAN